ncbi:hypothetical protein GOODEAATRI_031930, partial [Goodea atripinnis]
GGMEGSVMTYHCDPGKFPFPVSYRVCRINGSKLAQRRASPARKGSPFMGQPKETAHCLESGPEPLQFVMIMVRK